MAIADFSDGEEDEGKEVEDSDSEHATDENIYIAQSIQPYENAQLTGKNKIFDVQNLNTNFN